MNNPYTPSTPPRRIGQRTRLTPSSTPFATPSKSISNVNSYRKISKLSFNNQYSQNSSTPVRRSQNTPYLTPSQSPQISDETSVVYDRFIPSRSNMNMSLSQRAVLLGKKRALDLAEKDETPLQKEFKRRMLSTLCNVPLNKLDDDAAPAGILSFGGRSNQNEVENQYNKSRSGQIMQMCTPYSLDVLRSIKLGSDTELDLASQQSVASKVFRKVPSAPVRILDAPDIVDDYYLNLISWSKDNILAVALARSVYLWNASTGEISHLISVEGSDYITSVSWSSEPGNTKYICVGTHVHDVHLFDGQSLQKVRTMKGASGRIASLAWSRHLVSAGDRDGFIINHDVRADHHIASKYKGHTQEVCGLQWNDDGSCLASGGNENFLCLWDAAISARERSHTSRNALHEPRQILKQHKAAVKALGWCPFHRGLLASGGGTADRKINFWNTTSCALLNSVDTGSQVCSIIWSKHQRELCSSHGYSENQLILWKYPTMTKIKELTGHTARVLNMDISPDGSSIVSAGADETLRFWNIFETPSTQTSGDFGELSLGGRIR